MCCCFGTKFKDKQTTFQPPEASCSSPCSFLRSADTSGTESGVEMKETFACLPQINTFIFSPRFTFICGQERILCSQPCSPPRCMWLRLLLYRAVLRAGPVHPFPAVFGLFWLYRGQEKCKGNHCSSLVLRWAVSCLISGKDGGSSQLCPGCRWVSIRHLCPGRGSWCSWNASCAGECMHHIELAALALCT